MIEDIFANLLESRIHVRVRVAQDSQTDPCKIPVALVVFFEPCVFIMLGSVQFNGKSSRTAIKIHDEVADDLLPPKSNRLLLQEVEPQVSLFFGHVLSEIPGILKQIFISRVHTTPPPQCAHWGTSPFRGGHA